MADENRIFFRKGKIGKICHGDRNIFSEIEVNLKQGENASLPQGGRTPLVYIQCSRTSREVSLKPSIELIEAVLSCLKIIPLEGYNG